MHEIKIYGDIVAFNYWDGEFSIKNLNDQLDNLTTTKGDEVIIGINTFGGDVEAGFSIYNIIRRFAKEKEVSITTRLDGYCASIGTVILLAGDKRVGNEYSSPFVHNAWNTAVGDANEMKRVYLELEAVNNQIAKFYTEKANIDFETAKNLMESETWIDPTDALAYGFFTELENTNTPSKAMYNLLKENNFLRKNKNSINKKNKKMNNNKKSIWAKLEQLVNGTKNKIVFDAENKEVDFPELGESDEPKVGDKATIDGQPAKGEIVMATGETFVFENGTLTEIKPVVTEDNALAEANAKIESLTAEIESLKQNAINAENTIKDFKTTFNALKALESDVVIGDKKDNNKNIITKSAFAELTKNSKF